MTAEPMNPRAGVSGPGRFSKRTDTPPSAYYGEGVETSAISSGAAKAKTRGIADNVGGRPAQAPVPLSAPTQRPEEPITTGVDMGPGAGSEALMINQPADDTNFRATIKAYLPVLTYISGLPNTSPETRKAIRQIVDEL